MLDRLNRNKRFSSAQAHFKIGNVKTNLNEEFSLSLTLSDFENGLLSFTRDEFLCELTKRATVSAVRKSPKVDPAFVTVELISLKLQ